MISAQIYRNHYIDLYSELSNYLWDFETVKLIAELEIESHKIFPNVSILTQLLRTLRQHIMNTMLEDEALSNAQIAFEEAIKENEDIVVFIRTPKEVNPI